MKDNDKVCSVHVKRHSIVKLRSRSIERVDELVQTRYRPKTGDAPFVVDCDLWYLMLAQNT